MKLMIASDIHGSAYYCEKLLEAWKTEQPEKLLLLGDILYHGPRNDLPLDYAPKKVIALLNERRDSILCVRGNCDAEVDQFVLEFPILADYAVIDLGSRLVYATHGHVYGELNPPPLRKGDILLCGHTHIPKCVEYKTYTYMNPGSASLPKEDSHHGYMILQDGAFLWKDFDGNVIMRHH
jgi:putative phosphoesterase